MTDAGSGDGNPTLRLLGLTSGLGCSIAFILLVLIGGGIALDRTFDTSPLWTLVGVTAGVLAVAGELIAIVRISQSRAAQKPFPRSSRPPEPDDEE
jgi:F0F1-type ATP synthase assembly protein I